MGAKRIEYQIVGRYMNGKEVTGYHLQSIEAGKSGRYTKEQVCYLVGRDQVTNCSGQIYQDKVLLRGVGMSLDDLPVKQEDGGLSRTDTVGRVKRGTSAADAMTQIMLAGVITDGKEVRGYIVKNAGGGTSKITREELLQAARAGRVGNARAQMYQGKIILKGINCDLKKLPRYKAGTI